MGCACEHLQKALCADLLAAALAPIQGWVGQEADGTLLQLQCETPQSYGSKG